MAATSRFHSRTAQEVIARTKSSGSIEFQSYHEAYDKDFEDIRKAVPDLTKIKRTLNYAPKYTLGEIIDDVAAQQNRRPDSPRNSRLKFGKAGIILLRRSRNCSELPESRLMLR